MLDFFSLYFQGFTIAIGVRDNKIDTGFLDNYSFCFQFFFRGSMLARQVGAEQVAAHRRAAVGGLPPQALLGVAEELLLGQNQRRADPPLALELARSVLARQPANADARWLVAFLEVENFFLLLSWRMFVLDNFFSG